MRGCDAFVIDPACDNRLTFAQDFDSGWGMKKLFLASIAAAALYSAPAAAVSPSYNWTGCYIGVNAGGLWGKVETDFGAETKPNGFTGGGQLGCDYQTMSNWLVGLQGDFNWTHARDSQTTSTPVSTDTFDTRLDWFTSATARLGYASGPWLIYGKGGAAWVRDKFRDSGGVFVFGFDFSGTTTRSGWTAGGGLEYAFAPNWSAFLEYDYYGFGTKSLTLSGVNSAPLSAQTETVSVKQNFSVVKIGLNYRFATGR